MGFDKFTRRLALRGKTFIKANSASNQFAGSLTVNSGDASAVVSTSVVKSDSLIFHSFRSETMPASGQAFTVQVTSIADGGYFGFDFPRAIDGANTAGTGGTIYWEIRQP